MPHGRERDGQKEGHHKDRVYDQESKKHLGRAKFCISKIGMRKEMKCILRVTPRNVP